ncbi:MFS transporter [Schaalia vaccimaxillae]|uniref:MFS transporter n=1 Tax=Schaalia vaccimaxillae TaxID=183916 RepID=UPI00058C4665|nr:MFS transporter [Schaalia vaccimaxillae]
MSTVSTLVAFLAVVTISPSLRAGATSIGPLLGVIQASLGGGAIAAGILTALPCIVFSIMGFAAVPLSRRFGLTSTLALGMSVSVIGLAARPFASHYGVFLALSFLALVGPALGNVIVPAWVKFHKPGRAVMLITVYGAVLPLGGAIGSLIAVPMAGADGQHWRSAIGFWAFVALIGALFWLWVWRRVGKDFPPVVPTPRHDDEPKVGVPKLIGEKPRICVKEPSLMKSPTAIALMLMFGLQSLGAYVQFGQLPTILTSMGIDGAQAGAMIASINVWSVLGGLVMAPVIDLTNRSNTLPWLALLFGALTAAGYVTLIIAGRDLAWFCVTLLAIGGFSFPLAVALIPARSRSANIAARLSGMVQPGAYLLAAIGPVVVGVLLEATGSTALVLGLLAVSGGAMGIVGYRAAKPSYIDDELAAR